MLPNRGARVSHIDISDVPQLFEALDLCQRATIRWAAARRTPEDVAELAQSAGIPIYMISTREARLEPVSTAVFERMTAATGGKAYFSKNWRDERKAFASIRDDLGHLYSLSYYPKANQNHGWRSIQVKLVGEKAKKYRVRTRNGYRPQPNRFSTETQSAALGGGDKTN